MIREDRYLVVLNDEGHYSIWPEGETPPDGWQAEGFSGDEAECLDHIELVWAELVPRAVETFDP